VMLIRPAPGVTALASGAWLGPAHGPLRDSLAAVGYALRDVSAPLPHPNGHTVSCTLAAAPQAIAQLDADGADGLICGIAGLPGFHAQALARMWTSEGLSLRSTVITLPGTPGAGWSPVSLARTIDVCDADGREGVGIADALRAASAREGVKKLIVPAVFGTQAECALRAGLLASDGIEVGEALGVPPSLPGWRLDRALQSALIHAGVRVVHARVIEAVTSGRTVSAVRLDLSGDDVSSAASASKSITARSIILASGKFAGAGIEADPTLRETALGCPLWIEHLGDVFDAASQLVVTIERTATQPLLEAGVRCNENGNPVDRFGDVVYDNVFVAGSIRAGAETMGLGGASADGWSAGERAAEAA
jgi:glycerol-3-phosphate dehydrogenase subunit B